MINERRHVDDLPGTKYLVLDFPVISLGSVILSSDLDPRKLTVE